MPAVPLAGGWTQAGSVDHALSWPGQHARALLWYGAPGCAVCEVLSPRVLGLAERFGLAALYVNLRALPAAAASCAVLTVPLLSLWLDGVEVIREARFIRLDDVAARLERLLDLRG